MIVLCDNVRAEDGRVLEHEILSRMPDAKVVYVDPRVAHGRADGVLKAVDQAGAVVVAVYIVPSAAGRGEWRAAQSIPLLSQTRRVLCSRGFWPRCGKNGSSGHGKSIPRR